MAGGATAPFPEYPGLSALWLAVSDTEWCPVDPEVLSYGCQ